MQRGGGVKQHEEPRSSYARLCKRNKRLYGSGVRVVAFCKNLAQAGSACLLSGCAAATSALTEQADRLQQARR